MLRKLRLHYLRLPLKKPFVTAMGVEKERHTLIVELESADGEVGWGEVVADAGPWYSYETIETAKHVIMDFIAPLIKGKDLEPETFPDAVSRVRGHNMAKAGVEFALWDLKGKLLGKHVSELIGGVRDRVEIGLSVGVIGDEEALLKEVEAGLNLGYRRIKLKIKPGWDVKPVSLVRRVFGEIPLQVDANASYTLKQREVFEELDTYGLLMIEQPLHYDDLLEHADLQRLLTTPICLDESIKSVRDAAVARRLGSCRVINIKPGRVGGLNETIAIHNLAQSAGMPVWIGGLLETGVGRAFAVSAATLPNVKYPNDISPSSRFWPKDIVEPPWELRKDGTIEVPKKPGIGVEVLETVLRRYEVRTYEVSM